MKKTIKFLFLALWIMTCACAVLSCKSGTTDSPKDNVPSFSEKVDDEVVYSPFVKTVIVLGEGISARDVSLIRSTYHEVLDKEIELIQPSASVSTHEIVVGKTTRDISAKAYRFLELTDTENGEIGYVIYSDGKSIAIAFDEVNFDENIALVCALESFVEKYMKNNTLKLDSGVAYYERFEPVEKQSERDDEMLERLWQLKLSQIAEKVGGNAEKAEAIVNELRALYGIYNSNYSTLNWLANLYDPETGGFYYSNSARNNKGYLPDLESTSEALSIVELMLTNYSGTLTDYFGEEIAGKFVSFAKNMQDPNGYFYHPQWKKEITDKNTLRKSRDVVNALSILDFFGSAPIYDTPNGVKGEGSVSPASLITLPLGLNSAKSTVKLVSAQSNGIFIPAHLKSREAFTSYLNNLNIRANTETVSEELYSEAPLYLAIDEILEAEGANYRLVDVLEQYLSSTQNRTTGLWSANNNDRYGDVSAVSSVIKIYDAIGAPVSNYTTLINTITSAIETLDKPEEITELVSPWMSFYSVVNNLTTYSDEKQLDNVRFYLKSTYLKFDVLINKTLSNLSGFKRDDGSFSTTPNGSLGEALGMPIALPSMEEGDVSATFLATKSLWLSIFGVLEVGFVPLFTTSDRMMFQNVLFELGVIIKDEAKEVQPLDFEDYDVGDVPDITHKFVSSDSSIEVVKDPLREGNSVNLYSSSNKGSNWEFFYYPIMSSVKNASCYSYEFDMCVLPETSSGVFAQLYLYQDVYMISLSRSGDTISFYENSSRTSSITRTMDVGVTAKIGEWFNLRVEYYPAPHGSVRIKIYFNDECVVVSDNYYGCEAAAPVPSTNFSSLCIYAYLKQTMDILMDNVAVETTYQTYTVETGRLNRNVDYPQKPQTMHDFEKNNSGDTPKSFVPSGSSSSATVIKDSDGNKLLSLSENIGEIILPLDARGSDINSAIVEFDFILSDNSKDGAVYQISFNEYKYDNSVFGAMYIITKEENGRLYATFAERVSGEIGAPYQSVKLDVGEKHRISYQLFFNERAIVVSVDGVVVGINTNVSAVNRYYLGEIKLISETPSVNSEIFIDNVIVEKAAASFDDAIVPTIDRVVCEFDTADGIETSGVSPTNGVLSFESVTGSAFVKIPVNVRVSVPTIALVGFDVSVIENAGGELVVSLKDKEGNVIAAFILRSSGGEISIYEKTENGSYPTPIYTFKKSNFNFSVEYSEAKGNFNILVDGEYVTATSITYTWSSTAYDFEYLSIGCVDRAGFVIDNLYAEQICGIFKSQKIATPNLDPVNGVITYETSSFASMPSKIELLLGNTTAYHTIKEAKVKDAVSKVLEMNCGDGKSSTYSIFSKTQSSSGSNAVFFESELMLKTTSGTLDMMFEFMSSSHMAYSLSITTKGQGEPLRVLGKDLTVKEGEWFKLRIEYRDVSDDFDYDGLNDVLTRVYINGDLIAERYVPHNENNVVLSSAVSKIRVRNTSGRAGICYFDNSVFGDCNINYVPPVPADTDTLTYEPGIVTNKTQASFDKTTSKLTISELRVNGDITKVLEFYTSKSSSDKITLSPTLTEERINAVMLETDIMIDPMSDTVTLYIDPLTPAGNQPIRFRITAQKDGDVKLYSVSSVGESDPAMPDGCVIGKSGEWFKLKIEYMNPRIDYTGDGIDDVLCRIYVNNTLIKTLYKPYKAGAFYDPAIISRYVISATPEAEAHIYLDNTKFWQTELVADEAPAKIPDILIGEDKADSKFDTDGWV